MTSMFARSQVSANLVMQSFLVQERTRPFVKCRYSAASHTLGSLESLPNPKIYNTHGKICTIPIFSWRWNVHLSKSALPDWILLFLIKFWKEFRNYLFKTIILCSCLHQGWCCLTSLEHSPAHSVLSQQDWNSHLLSEKGTSGRSNQLKGNVLERKWIWCHLYIAAALTSWATLFPLLSLSPFYRSIQYSAHLAWGGRKGCCEWVWEYWWG